MSKGQTPKVEAPKAEPVNLSAMLGSLGPLANMARRIVEIQSIVEAGASVQAAIGEAERAIAGKQAELADIVAQVDKAKAELVAAMNADADRLSAAKSEAASVIDKAKLDAQNVIKRADEALKTAEAKRDAMFAEADQAQHMANEARAEYEALTTKIANAKEAARNLLRD